MLGEDEPRYEAPRKTETESSETVGAGCMWPIAAIVIVWIICWTIVEVMGK